MVIATIFGSLAAAVYMLYANYRTLGYPKLAVRIAFVGWVIYAGLIFATSRFPTNSSTTMIGFAVLQAVIAYGACQVLQGQALTYHAQHSGSFHSIWTAITIGFLATLLLVVVLMGYLLLQNAFAVTG